MPPSVGLCCTRCVSSRLAAQAVRACSSNTAPLIPVQQLEQPSQESEVPGSLTRIFSGVCALNCVGLTQAHSLREALPVRTSQRHRKLIDLTIHMELFSSILTTSDSH